MLRQKEDHDDATTPLLGDEDASKFTTIAHFKVSVGFQSDSAVLCSLPNHRNVLALFRQHPPWLLLILWQLSYRSSLPSEKMENYYKTILRSNLPVYASYEL